jgi:peptidoglycan/LPS O-acetylase OafA/YrhL
VASCALRGKLLLGQVRGNTDGLPGGSRAVFRRRLTPQARPSASASMHPTGRKLAYRPDLDGLRAIAVLSVILFHFDFVTFGGGFVGVDIFFVVSGYLITSIIVGELESGSFSFARFYERRIRRIVPALVAMLVATTMAAIALFPPKELAEFGLSAAAAAAFCSNVFFAFHTNYFAGPDTMMPLLHTWSLGVEEQFYIVWPLLLFATYRIGSRLAVSVLVVGLAVASLAYSEWGTASKYAAQLFYLLQSRAWELMFGAILALGLMPRIDNRWLRDGLALLGIGMIAFAVTQLSSATPYPGLWATIPCLGAVLIIFTGQQRDTAVYRLLSLEPLTFIGLISYSLYLWHWPVYAFAENYVGRPITLGESLALIILCIAVAAASWRYVERPFRDGARRAVGSQRAYFVGGLGALGLAACVGGAIYLGDGLQWRLGPEPLRVYLSSREHNALRADCLRGSGGKLPAASHCTQSPLNAGDTADIVVWGDSHADALFPGIAMIGEDHGLSTRQVTRTACPPLLGAERVSSGSNPKRGKTSACTKFNAALLERLKEDPRPSLVVIAARWSMYTETTVAFAGGRRVFLVDDENDQLDIETSRKVLSRALVRTVDAINALGIRVLLIGQPPEFYQDPTVCFVERSISWRNVNDCLKQPRQLLDQRLRASKAILQNVTNGRPATSYVSLDSILCDDQVCRTWEDGQPLYEDTTHLDLSGARVIGNALAEMPSLVSFFVPQGAIASTHASINRMTH